jgi:diguanylate cyclase (GGDEF)-like protein
MLLFYCDVDALKSINDTLGHSAGDTALKDCADILRQTFRDSDIVARTGGDEFVVLALESNNRSIETLRARLDANLLAFDRSAGRPFRLELSIGIATYDPLLEETLEQTLKRADSLMYRHKQARRRARELERSELQQ